MKRLALALMALAALGISPAAAEAVVRGPNGPFAFASGRDDGATTFGDANAQLWMLAAPGATAFRLSSGFDLYMHRHPTWSPDRTKIAYARCATSGCMFNGPWDIYVQDLLNGGPPLDITNSAQSEDRPAWSPDGTRIAYAKQTAATNWDIEVMSASGGGGETTVATAASQEAGGWKQARAQWTPDSQSLIYAKFFSAAPDYDIFRAPADGSNPGGTAIDFSPTNDYQPAVSPNGDKICFTRDTGMAPNFKDVYIEPITGGTATPLVTTTGDDFECAWSPDEVKVAFGRGGFGNGQIFTRNADGSDESLVTDVAGRFDGNVDWAPNPRPGCADRAVSVAFNEVVSIPLACTDRRDPPFFFPPRISPAIATGPSHGVLGSIASDGSVIYKPNTNFTGTDTFTYKGNDGTSNSALASVTINVIATPPEKASFKGSKSSIRVNRKRRFKFTFHATPGLTGKAVFKSIKSVRVSRKRRVTLARKRFTVPASGKVTLRIKLSKKKFRILKLNRTIRVRVTVTLKNAIGLRSKASKKVRLKAPKRRRQ